MIGQITISNFAHGDVTQGSGVYAEIAYGYANKTSDLGSDIFFRQKSSVKLLTFEILCFDVFKTFSFCQNIIENWRNHVIVVATTTYKWCPRLKSKRLEENNNETLYLIHYALAIMKLMLSYLLDIKNNWLWGKMLIFLNTKKYKNKFQLKDGNVRS